MYVECGELPALKAVKKSLSLQLIVQDDEDGVFPRKRFREFFFVTENKPLRT